MRDRKGDKMSEQAQNVQQQTQEDQYLQEAQSFFGQSIGRVRSQVQNYHEQLERYAEQAPAGDAQALIQEMVDYYSEIEGTMERAAQDAGVEDEMNQAAEQTNQQMQEVAQGAAQQAQDTAGQAAGQAQEAAGQATDKAGQVAGQAQDAAGGAAQQGQQAAQQATGGGDDQQQPDATQAAQQKAQELGVDLSQVQGTGAGGRITIRDVIGASNQ
jgi:pyruvate/2-oxoglutarate dehydrogenase complex dihydrolipoamide acyltransferase (E2) component